MEDLLPEVEVLEQRPAPLTDSQRVLIVAHRDPLLRREAWAAHGNDLVRLAPGAEIDQIGARHCIGSGVDGGLASPRRHPGALDADEVDGATVFLVAKGILSEAAVDGASTARWRIRSRGNRHLVPQPARLHASHRDHGWADTQRVNDCPRQVPASGPGGPRRAGRGRTGAGSRIVASLHGSDRPSRVRRIVRCLPLRRLHRCPIGHLLVGCGLLTMPCRGVPPSVGEADRNGFEAFGLLSCRDLGVGAPVGQGEIDVVGKRGEQRAG